MDFLVNKLNLDTLKVVKVAPKPVLCGRLMVKIIKLKLKIINK